MDYPKRYIEFLKMMRNHFLHPILRQGNNRAPSLHTKEKGDFKGRKTLQEVRI